MVDEIGWPQLSIFIQPPRQESKGEQKNLGREREVCKQNTHAVISLSHCNYRAKSHRAFVCVCLCARGGGGGCSFVHVFVKFVLAQEEYVYVGCCICTHPTGTAI